MIICLAILWTMTLLLSLEVPINWEGPEQIYIGKSPIIIAGELGPELYKGVGRDEIKSSKENHPT